MNDALAAIALGRRIDLTREADFVVGGMQVHPTACEVVLAGERIRLQPRVMQVLIALTRAGGEAVSRESLSEICWGQVTVTDDALNRCIQRLRRLSEEAKGSFVIETISRLGYRLRAIDPPPSTEHGPVNPATTRWRLRSVVAGGVATLAALAAAGLWMWNTKPAHWSIERSETLVSTPLLEGQPALSPDGTMLVYAAGPSFSSGHLYLKRLSSVESIPLSDGAADGSPAWSPDSASVAYVSWRAGEPCRIKITAVPAGLAREVGRCQTAEFTGLAWSAAGDALFIADSPNPGGASQITRVDLASGRRSAITHPPGGFDDIEPRISPDGRWLLYSRVSTLPDRTIIHNLATGEERILAQLPQEYLGKAWADDSKSVFYVGETAQGISLWSYPIDGGARGTLIGKGLPLNLRKIATARGGLLAAEYITGRWNAVRPPGPGEKGPVVVDPANNATSWPGFAPDGTLAMGSTRSGEGAIWLMRPGERARMLLSYATEIPVFASWSPDGAELAFVTLGPEIDVRVVTSTGLEVAKIKAPGTEVGEPAWSGDGHALLFPVRDSGGWKIWRTDLAPSKPPYPITGYGWAVVRTVGDVVYAAKPGLPGIWKLNPTPKEIIASFSGRIPWAWRIFKDRIVYADENSRQGSRLLSAPLAGGPALPFADVPGIEQWQFTIDPRSGTPVYVAAMNVDLDIELFHLKRN